MRIAIDTGGTFTDCVCLTTGADGGAQLRVLKVFSTPVDASRAVLQGIAQIRQLHAESMAPSAADVDAGAAMLVCHGTTVGTNTMLERTGARVALVTTAGFEDVIAIGRQTRAHLYDWMCALPQPLVKDEMRFGVAERVAADGRVLLAPDEEHLERVMEAVKASGAEAVAIATLFSFLAPEAELAIAEALRPLGLPLSLSHRILPEFREYERTSTTVVNAYLMPRMAAYLGKLSAAVGERYDGAGVEVMQSSGGIVSAEIAAREPVRTVLSGPAGGVVGACRVAAWSGVKRIIGVDVGGTSTDVFLAANTGDGVELSREAQIGGVPVSVAMLNIHTVGAGGGSLARLDAGGMLRVGPESAGADPGPICFGRGTRPTVTDANLLLGRLEHESFLGGAVALDVERTRAVFEREKGALATVEEFAAGITSVVENNMARAVRVISVEKGHDPRDYTLVAFGGGGPLHACALARALRMKRVLIPLMPGALSAVGILLADGVRDSSRTVMMAATEQEGVLRVARELMDQANKESPYGESKDKESPAKESPHGLRPAESQLSLDLRYAGQGYELNVPLQIDGFAAAIAAFHALHEKRYGFRDLSRAVVVVNVRLRMVSVGEAYEPKRTRKREGDGRGAVYKVADVWFDEGERRTRFYRREGLVAGDRIMGPAMITEYSAATLLPPGALAEVDEVGNILIDLPEDA